MGLVFFGRQTPQRSLNLHKHITSQQTAIEERAVQPSTCEIKASGNKKSVKKLSSENLLFLQSLGLFKNKK